MTGGDEVSCGGEDTDTTGREKTCGVLVLERVDLDATIAGSFSRWIEHVALSTVLSRVPREDGSGEDRSGAIEISVFAGVGEDSPGTNCLI